MNGSKNGYVYFSGETKKRTWVRTFSQTRQLQAHVLFQSISLHISLLDPTEQVQRMRGCFVLSQLLYHDDGDDKFFRSRG